MKLVQQHRSKSEIRWIHGDIIQSTMFISDPTMSLRFHPMASSLRSQGAHNGCAIGNMRTLWARRKRMDSQGFT